MPPPYKLRIPHHVVKGFLKSVPWEEAQRAVIQDRFAPDILEQILRLEEDPRLGDELPNGDRREAPAEAAGEACSRISADPAGRRERIWGRLDPAVARLARWADEDPAAMRRLLEDNELRAQLLAALEAVAPSEDEASSSEAG